MYLIKATFTWHQTGFYPEKYSCGYGMRLHGTTLSEQVFDQLSVQVFDLLRKHTSAGQIFNRYRVNAHPKKFLHRFVPVSSFAVFMNNLIRHLKTI